MELKNFESVRVGSGFPAAFDVCRINGHESAGVFAVGHTYRTKDTTNFMQLRKHSKENMVALFSFKYEEVENYIPDYWNDSVVIWDSRDTK
jgi:hypothetical protein